MSSDERVESCANLREKKKKGLGPRPSGARSNIPRGKTTDQGTSGSKGEAVE